MTRKTDKPDGVEKFGIPPWLALMRRAAMEAVSADDVRQMVAAQVAKAKAGDQAALKFVFEHVLGGAQLKGAQFVQHNHYGRPGEPTAAKPGSEARIDLMAERARRGLPLAADGDAAIGDE